jgi:hypothetical protein
VFVYVTAEWPSDPAGPNATTNQAVIWDSIITSPSADHLANIGPAAMKKLRKSSQGKSIDPSRYVLFLFLLLFIIIIFWCGRGGRRGFPLSPNTVSRDLLDMEDDGG